LNFLHRRPATQEKIAEIKYCDPCGSMRIKHREARINLKMLSFEVGDWRRAQALLGDFSKTANITCWREGLIIGLTKAPDIIRTLRPGLYSRLVETAGALNFAWTQLSSRSARCLLARIVNR